MEKLPALLGISPAIKQIDEDLTLAAKSDAKVLLTGESGVGKEVVACLIHHRSSRSQRPLVTINCAGVPDSLLASELFGSVRGSFTDSYADKRGWLEQADRGTIFLDEVAEMSSQMQPLLLRFLENGEVQPVGSDRRRTVVDVRVICATNRRLIDRVEAKEFREDLYYRLNVIHIDIPPLRDRQEDVPVLLSYFVRQMSAKHGVDVPTMSDEVSKRLAGFSWPGNVRQLRNVAERIALRARGRVVTMADLPQDVFFSAQTGGGISDVHKTTSDVLFEALMTGKSFWPVVCEPFLRHDVTRQDVHDVLQRGFDLTGERGTDFPSAFKLPAEDHKRVMNFLRKLQAYSALSLVRSLPERPRSLPRDRERRIG